MESPQELTIIVWQVALPRSQATQSLGVYLGYLISSSHKYKDLVLQVWQHLPVKHVSKYEEQSAKAKYWAAVSYTTPQHAM
jgi:hypothetical protein